MGDIRAFSGDLGVLASDRVRLRAYGVVAAYRDDGWGSVRLHVGPDGWGPPAHCYWRDRELVAGAAIALGWPRTQWRIVVLTTCSTPAITLAPTVVWSFRRHRLRPVMPATQAVRTREVSDAGA